VIRLPWKTMEEKWIP